MVQTILILYLIKKVNLYDINIEFLLFIWDYTEIRGWGQFWLVDSNVQTY